jgi:hypothetical protein
MKYIWKKINAHNKYSVVAEVCLAVSMAKYGGNEADILQHEDVFIAVITKKYKDILEIIWAHDDIPRNEELHKLKVIDWLKEKKLMVQDKK